MDVYATFMGLALIVPGWTGYHIYNTSGPISLPEYIQFNSNGKRALNSLFSKFYVKEIFQVFGGETVLIWGVWENIKKSR